MLTSMDRARLSGATELVQPPRGICLRISEWQDALFWVTVEGSRQEYDVQILISAFDMPQNEVNSLGASWAIRLQAILG
jgi:hypothetical protein